MEQNNKYLLSICIPTLNRSTYLHSLLNNISLEITKYNLSNDLQIVIIDGNSNDDTESMVSSYDFKCNKKYFRRQVREGIDKDIIKSIELSNSDFCWLFSDDDLFTDGAINHVLDILKKDRELSGCFCNRVSYDFQMKHKVAEISQWPGKIFEQNRLFTNKSECIKLIGMDFGFISSQIINRTNWLEAFGSENYGDLYKSYYFMVHIFFRMMNKKFKWLYIHKQLIIQRTGNDTLLNNEGVIKRQNIEHESFEKILNLHYKKNSSEFFFFFNKMVHRLPRAIANLKSQNIPYSTQLDILKLLFKKYNKYVRFWFIVIPIFFIPNVFFHYLKHLYFKYTKFKMKTLHSF
jgi:abequosyltransferase